MKATLTDEERKTLLKFARSVIAAELKNGATKMKPEQISDRLMEKRGCFVTLHKRQALRGCIGTIDPLSPLIQCVEENALNAAFNDPRFPPLTKEELTDIDIEISVLTVPETIECSDSDDLKRKLNPGVHGVILSKGMRRATFLPQVWEQLPQKEEFLDHLCLKAGLESKSWMKSDIEVKIYEAEYFSENPS